MISHNDIKKIVKNQVLNIINEEKASNIERLVYSILRFSLKGNMKKYEEYYGLLFTRLSALGFDRQQLMSMKAQIGNITNEREAEKFIHRWKLTDDYILNNTVNVFYILLGIPFSTDKNKEEKEKQLKYDLAINDIKLLKISKPKISSMIAPAGSAGNVINLKFMIKIKTTHSISEIEKVLQPDYDIEKINQKDN
jgi:hypothetical protein